MTKASFRELAVQKNILGHVQTLAEAGQLSIPKNTKTIFYALEGLTNFLDYIQDQAVDSGQVPESVVFPFSSDKE